MIVDAFGARRSRTPCPLPRARHESLVRRERRDHRRRVHEILDGVDRRLRAAQRIERAARRIGERYRLEARPRRVDPVEQSGLGRVGVGDARHLEMHAAVHGSACVASAPCPCERCCERLSVAISEYDSPSSGAYSPTSKASVAPAPLRRSAVELERRPRRRGRTAGSAESARCRRPRRTPRARRRPRTDDGRVRRPACPTTPRR